MQWCATITSVVMPCLGQNWDTVGTLPDKGLAG